MTLGKYSAPHASKHYINMDLISAELSGKYEHGLNIRHQPLPPIKSSIGGVLFKTNPAHKNRLNERLQVLNARQSRRKHALEWNQTQYFASQVFDRNENLSFSQTNKDIVEMSSGPIQNGVKMKTSPQRKGIFGLTQPVQSNSSIDDPAPKRFLPRIAPGQNVGGAPCSDELINRLITTLPPKLLKKANDAINTVVTDEKLKLIENNKARSRLRAVEDIRFKQLESVLIKSNVNRKVKF